MHPARNACIVFLLAVPIFGQKAPTGPTTPTPTPTRTAPSTFPNPATNPNNSASQPAMPPRPIFLSGKVVLQDGTPPPEPVKIERICNGSPRPQGYTDLKGRFSFQVDSGLGVEPDASDPTFRNAGSPPMVQNGRGLSSSMLTGCELRAVLPGFLSGTVNLGIHTMFDNPDVGTIVLRRMGEVDGTTISMTSLNAPKDAQKAYQKGRDALKKEKADEAEKDFLKAVEIYPKYAMAWYQLGLLQARKQNEEAEKSFQRSIEADSKFVSPYLDLAVMYQRSQKWEDALKMSDAAVKLNSKDFPQAYFYKAVAQYNLKDNKGAEASVLETVRLDSQHQWVRAEMLLAVISEQKNDLPGAADHLRNYLKFAPNAKDAAEVRKQLEAIEKQTVAGK